MTRSGVFVLLALVALLRAPPALASFTVGSFTKATGVAPASQTIAHGLGETPKAVILWTDGKTSESFSPNFVFGFGVTDGTTSAFLSLKRTRSKRFQRDEAQQLQ